MDIFEFLYQISLAYPVATAIVFAIVSIAFLALAAMYARHVGLEKIKRLVLDGFVRAEKEFQHGDNQQKFEFVVQLARSHIPYPYNLLISETGLRKTIQLWFDLAKRLLDY